MKSTMPELIVRERVQANIPRQMLDKALALQQIHMDNDADDLSLNRALYVYENQFAMNLFIKGEWISDITPYAQKLMGAAYEFDRLTSAVKGCYLKKVSHKY